MTATALHWVEAHGAAVPQSLQEAMTAAAAATAHAAADAPLPAQLAAAAMHCLRDALEKCEDRTAALPLLAADALITGACEAAASDQDAILRLAADFGPERLAPLLDAP